MQQIGRLVEEIVILSDAFQYFRFQDSSPQIVTAPPQYCDLRRK